jgi:hypothetical protein
VAWDASVELRDRVAAASGRPAEGGLAGTHSGGDWVRRRLAGTERRAVEGVGIVRRIRLVLAAGVLAVAGLGISTPASSSTCIIANATLDQVVCGTIKQVTPLLAPLCKNKPHFCLGLGR